MTRRRKLQAMGIAYALASLSLLGITGWQVYDAFRNADTSMPIKPLLSLGLAATLAVPAWGLWFGTRWGWLVAVLCLSLFLATILIDAGPLAIVCLLLLGQLYNAAPQPPRTRLIADVDQLASTVGLKWEDTPIASIGELLQTGKFDAAAKVYRDATEATWDEAWFAVSDWENNEVEAKVRFLVRHLKAHTVGENRDVAITAEP